MAKIFARMSRANKVVELVSERADITKEWAPAFLATLVDVTGHAPPVEIGWVRGEGGAYAPAPAPVLTRSQRMVAAIAAGCAVTSAGTPGLDATYDASGVRWQQMRDEALYIASFGAFSGGLSVLDWPAKTGVVEFATIDQLKAVARAIGDWLTLWQRYAAGASEEPPASPVAIA